MQHNACLAQPTQLHISGWVNAKEFGTSIVSAYRRGHSVSDTRSDAANLRKMHRRRRQTMVLYDGSGFWTAGSLKADRSKRDVTGGCIKEAAQRSNKAPTVDARKVIVGRARVAPKLYIGYGSGTNAIKAN
jgi:hypothetical protein